MPRLRFPHALTLLVACVGLAAALTHLLPAGRYQRREDPASGRTVVVAGTYQRVAPSPVSPFQALVAIPKGMSSAASVIFLVFLVGGAFTVVDRTRALNTVVDRLVRRLVPFQLDSPHNGPRRWAGQPPPLGSHRLAQIVGTALARRELLVLPIVGLAFATGGALFNMGEEIIAFVPVLLLLTRRLGFPNVIVVAVSLGCAIVAAAFSPINPFQAGIAQKVSGLPLLSGSAFRMAFLVPALGLWLGGMMRYAARTRTKPEAAELGEAGPVGWRESVIVTLVLASFAVLVLGIMRFDWEFDHMSALFFTMGAAAGIVGGLGVDGTAEAFVEGFRSMAFAGLLIGFARAIYVVLEQGQIVDTMVHGLFTPLAGLPVALSAVGMMAAHTAVHFPVPSVSGQAVLTLPLLVPLSDLLGLSRQVTVLAYQCGAGLCEMLTPTNGALMAMLAASGVKYEEWLRFMLPIYAALVVWGVVAIGVGIGVGLT